jgi:hypothetical protein
VGGWENVFIVVQIGGPLMPTFTRRHNYALLIRRVLFRPNAPAHASSVGGEDD